MKSWSNNWKSSTKPRKQRKYRFNAPLNIKRKLMSSHLSKELRQKYIRRCVVAVKGDKVKVMRGQFADHVGKIEKVDSRKTKVTVSGIEIQKKDGSKANLTIHPSNLLITELNLNDKKRVLSIERKSKKQQKKE